VTQRRARCGSGPSPGQGTAVIRTPDNPKGVRRVAECHTTLRVELDHKLANSLMADPKPFHNLASMHRSV
jgi:hypothetical protein